MPAAMKGERTLDVSTELPTEPPTEPLTGAPTGAPTGAQAPEKNEEQEFDTAFEAFAAGETAPESQPDKATATSKEDEAAEETEKREAVVPQPEKTDLWSQAPEPLRAAFEATRQEAVTAQQAARSQAGRVTAYQRKVDELEAQIKQLQSQTVPANPSAAAPSAAAPSTTEGATDKKATAEEDAWAQFEKEYPEVAGPIKEKLDRAQRDRFQQDRSQQVDPGRQAALDQLLAERAQMEVERQVRELSVQHPDWVAVTESEGFRTWAEAAHPSVQAMLAVNADQINDAAQAAMALSLFKTSQQGRSAQAGPTKIQQKRQRQLEGNTGVHAQRGSGGAGEPPENDFDAAFAYFANRK